jgi:hypothetical protein
MWFALAGFILCGLKIAGVTVVATWPWWLVTLPFWIGIALLLTVLLFGGAMLGLFVGLVSWMDRK